MRRDIDISLLRAFLSVAETGSMTGASRQLDLTQAAVSQQIRRLEEFFGQTLISRGERRLQLTTAGERLFAYAQRILALNDEVWGVMTAPEFVGEVRLGVPVDLVVAYMPPILKNFNQSWPRVRVSLVCGSTAKLMQALSAGEVDLTLTTEQYAGEGSEMLLLDQLVWVGAKGGNAYQRTPLPVSFGDPACAFRASAARALTEAGRDWQLVCETSHFSPHCATLEADIAVAPMMATTVPRNLQILGKESGLPPLPPFYINLRMSQAGASDITRELARFIKSGFDLRRRAAA